MKEVGSILVVDDHVELAENVAEILDCAGIPAQTAFCAELALDALARGRFAALLTDFCLPGLSGAELIRTLRAQGSDIPALVMSAYTDAATREDAERAGAVAVLPKPVAIPELLDHVRRLLRSKADSVIDRMGRAFRH